MIALAIAYLIASRSMAGQATVHRVLMRIPIVGQCMRSFAIARFSWAFALTQQAGMPILQSVTSSFRATANGVFIGKEPIVRRMVEEGEHLTDALRESALFPGEFIEMVYVGETTGTVPETLERLSPQFEEAARRDLEALAATAGWLIWSLVAVFIVVIIFRIISTYIGLLQEVTTP